MDYIKAFVVKYLMTTALLWVVLNVLYDAGFSQMLLLSLVLTIAGFFLGDLFILPRFENGGATIADFLLVFAGVWLFSTYFTAAAIPPFAAASLAAIIISVCEVFFHKYIDSQILHSDDPTGGRTREELSPEERMQTEFGKDMAPSDKEE